MIIMHCSSYYITDHEIMIHPWHKQSPSQAERETRFGSPVDLLEQGMVVFFDYLPRQ